MTWQISTITALPIAPLEMKKKEKNMGLCEHRSWFKITFNCIRPYYMAHKKYR